MSGRIRKQRAVSFEQPTLHQKWCDFPLMSKTPATTVEVQQHHHQNQLNIKLSNEDINMMDTTPPPILQHHYKPPRL